MAKKVLGTYVLQSRRKIRTKNGGTKTVMVKGHAVKAHKPKKR